MFLGIAVAASQENKPPPAGRQVAGGNPSEGRSTSGWFLELVSESSDRPFENDKVIPPHSHLRLTGYFFEPATDESPAQLFPAIGTAPAKPDEVKFYLGYRILDLAPEPIPGLRPPDDFEHRALLAVTESETVFAGETLAREELRKKRAIHAAERPESSLKIEKNDDGMTINFNDRTFKLQPGKAVVLRESAGPDKDQPVYHRLTAIVHQDVKVASFDALQEWNRSQELLVEGPYEDALAATERVLQADPTDKLALAQWQQIQALIEAGKTASVLEANLKFAAGLDAKSILKQWQQKPAGLLYLSAPDAPAGEALAGRMIDAETVQVPAPSGRYRVTLLLPGFRPFQQEIEINGRTKLEIPIEKAAP